MSHKPPIASGSGEYKGALTMDITRATLPTGPMFFPQPSKSTKNEQVASFVGQESDNTGMHSTLMSQNMPCNLPPTQEHTTVSKAGPRSRYVLPPGMVMTPTASNSVRSLLPSPAAVSADQIHQPSLLEVNPPPYGLPPSSHNIGATANTPSDQTISQTTAPSFSLNHDLSRGEPYQPLTAHWFYAAQVNGYTTWLPFSRHDSHRLETAALGANLSSQSSDCQMADAPLTAVVAVDGGLYDIFVAERERRAVYWEEAPSQICRSTWFYRLPDEARIMPFPESTCLFLEARYKWTVETGTWGQQFEMPSNDQRGGHDIFVFNSPQSLVQYLAWPYRGPHAVDTSSGPGNDALNVPSSSLETTATEGNGRVCQLRRGLDQQLLSQLDDGDLLPIDHVFFVIHGIGSVYNMKGEGLVSCVDGLRKTARQMAQSHFPHHSGRVEFLPVMWHDALHSDSTGVDEQLARITLRSIPKLRQFTNNTLTDILFYTSSKFCQIIVDTVAREICRLHHLFLSRNPNFKGVFSVIGHSLGAVMAFDLLANQQSLPSGAPLAVYPVQLEPMLAVLADDDSTSTVSIATKQSVDAKDDLVEDVDIADFVQPPVELQPELTGDGGRSSNRKPHISTGEVVEGWSLVNYQNVGPQSVRRPQRPNRLINILSRAGLTQDQIKHVLDCWLATESERNVPGTSSFWLDGNQPHCPDESVLAGFGMPVVIYPQLGFPVAGLYMLGSPLPVFLTARGIRQLSPDYQLPTCPLVYNIFHPFDPVAYRMETIIEPTFQPRAVLIPHHKGRKRLHLQLKDNLVRMGSDIKSKIYQSVQSTWRSLQDFALSHRFLASSATSNLHGDETEDSTAINRFLSRLAGQPGDGDDATEREVETVIFTGQLNQGRRIDFVLQEAPLESFSDYLFALSSHAVYWESEDTALFLLSEAYLAQSGVVPLVSSQKKATDSCAPNNQSLSQTLSMPPLLTHQQTEAAGPALPDPAYPQQPEQQPQKPPALFVCSPTSTTSSHVSDKAWQSNTSDSATYSLAESSLSETTGFATATAPPLPPPPPAMEAAQCQHLTSPSGGRQPAPPEGTTPIPTYRHQRPRPSVPPLLRATLPAPCDFIQPAATPVSQMPLAQQVNPAASDAYPPAPPTAIPSSMMESVHQQVRGPAVAFSPQSGGQPVHQLHPKPVSNTEPNIFPPTFPPRS